MAEWEAMFGDDHSDSSDEEDAQVFEKGDHPKHLKPPPFVIKQIPGIGGLRGVFAAEDLLAGTLILAECPIYTWKGHFSDVDVLRSTVTGICSSQKAHRATKALHPFVLEDADEEEISTMKELWGESLSLAVADLGFLEGSEDIDANEVLRVSIALQHNAYGSGFYEMFSLVNHTCAPNCTKLCPSMDKGWRKASEIWTNCDVKKGDELTICYNHIREMTEKSVAQFLHEHHRFKCTCSLHPRDAVNSPSDPPCLSTLESSSGSLRPHVEDVSDGEEDVVQDTEMGAEKEEDWSAVLQERVEYYEEQLKMFTRFEGAGAGTADKDTKKSKKKDLDMLVDIITVCGEILTDIEEHCKRNHFSSLQRISDSFLSVGESQLLKPAVTFPEPLGVDERDGMYMMVRLYKIVISAASVAIQELGTEECTLLAKNKSEKAYKVFEKLLWSSEQYLLHALDIAVIQLFYLGDAHPDIAQTFLDIAEGISCAFSLTAGAEKYTAALRADGDDEESRITSDVLQRVYSFSPERHGWARSRKSAQLMMETVRMEGERVANLYRSRYDLVQERLVTTSLLMPDAYI